MLFPGGEAQALERLERHLQKPAWIASFEKPKTSPNSLEPSTTVLSPYLKFGCLSARRFYHELKQASNEDWLLQVPALVLSALTLLPVGCILPRSTKDFPATASHQCL